MTDKTPTSAPASKPQADETKLPDLPRRDGNAAQEEQLKGGAALAGGGVPGIRQQ